MNQTTLLCEDCGYVLAGLPAGGKCPECGKEIAESLPERRPGSAWQRAGTVPWGWGWVCGWARASWSVLRRPRATFRSVIIEARLSRRLLVVNLTAGSLAMGAAGARLLGYDRGLSSTTGTAAEWGGSLVGLAVLWYVVLLGLTRIESAGIRFFGRRRGWRVTPDLATAVCAHASVGWAAAGLGVLAVSMYWQAHWGPGTTLVQRLSAVQYYWVWAPSLAGVFLAGLVLFEILVYIGVRECRYANPPGAGVSGVNQAGRAAG